MRRGWREERARRKEKEVGGEREQGTKSREREKEEEEEQIEEESERERKRRRWRRRQRAGILVVELGDPPRHHALQPSLERVSAELEAHLVPKDAASVPSKKGHQYRTFCSARIERCRSFVGSSRSSTWSLPLPVEPCEM